MVAGTVAARGIHYYDALRQLHTKMKPATYVEIGVAAGGTLDLIQPRTSALGVDPSPRLRRRPWNVRILRSSSAEAFEGGLVDKWLKGRTIDMSFIDGLHEFQTVLEDFIDVEARCRSDSLVLIHDCLPQSEQWLDESSGSSEWTGDVWKLVEVLLRYRHDLEVVVLDAAPSGVAVVRSLDSTNDVLSVKIVEIGQEFAELGWDDFVSSSRNWPVIRCDEEAVAKLGSRPFESPSSEPSALRSHFTTPYVPYYLHKTLARIELTLTKSRLSRRIRGVLPSSWQLFQRQDVRR